MPRLRPCPKPWQGMNQVNLANVEAKREADWWAMGGLEILGCPRHGQNGSQICGKT